MKKFIIILTVLTALAFGGGAGIHIYGMTLPEKYAIGTMVMVQAPQTRVWEVLTDYKGMTSWWPDVTKVDEEIRPDGVKVTWLTGKDGQKLPYVTVEETKPAKLVRKVANEQLPFGATWTFQLSSHGGVGTIISIRENGFNKAPFFRAMMKFSGGPEKNLKSLRESLEKKFKFPN